MKCLTFEQGQSRGGKWMPLGTATIYADQIGAVVDYEGVPGTEIRGAGFMILVNLPREKIVEMIGGA